MRGALEARFAAAVAAARADAGERAGAAGAWGEMRLPPVVRETLVAAAGVDRGAAETLVAYYCEKMPRMAVEQRCAGDAATRLLHRRIELARLPRLGAALEGMCAALRSAGLDAAELLGAATPAELVALRPTVAELFAPTLHGPGLPLLGAYPAERDVISGDLAAGAAEDAVIDLRLSGNLAHELCHGPCRETVGEPPPWMIIEAAAIHLGFAAFPRHVFPDEPGEAVPSVSLFVLVGEALARRFGRRAFWSISFGASLAEAFGARPAAALAAAGWQDWLRRRQPPFVSDALAAEAWVKLIDASRAPGREVGADALGEADRTPWPALPWWSEEPAPEDDALVEPAVRALFQVSVLAPNLRTNPAELVDGRITLDVEACRLTAAPRPDGAFAEPARWLFPPPLARRLHERGARRVIIAGAARAGASRIATTLLDLAHGAAPLAAETTIGGPAR